MTALGIARGLDQCASPSGKFTLLALDHRQNLRRDLRPSDPGSVGPAELIDFKRSVTRAIGAGATGVLLDPQFGAAQCIADGSLPGAVGLIVAHEKTGYDGLTTDRRTVLLEHWSPAKARSLGASAAKLLVYYHPEARGAREQERLVERVARECHEVELPLFLEPLTFSLVEGMKLVGEQRRRAVIETARRLAPLGVDVLKVEFPYDSGVDDRRLWTEACVELNAAVNKPWVLLSGGVGSLRFNAQVETACSAGASGVAAGRAIWAEATTMVDPQRRVFLREVAASRLAALRELVEQVAHPWTDAPGLGRPTGPIAEDWLQSKEES